MEWFMKKIALIIFCLFAVTATPTLSAAWKVYKVGNFPIVGTIQGKGFVLNDGNIYKPKNSSQRTITTSWQLGDNILLLKGKGKKTYILVNARTGQKATMKNVNW